ncbi:1673_t:CDS:1 [Paraglomus occultum]|uniref:Large ribosomal subunit protein uL2m n=1 Tax=Paraglomus occultum TaxID=144539 RepID=A0A9N9CI15_9GLOM|nr:1673_t:CDS:1 [Paraglomus occultum]
MKTVKPLTNSRRKTILINYREKLVPYKNKPPRKLLQILQPHSGRNNQGRITVRHQGGRHKRKYRFIERMAKSGPGNPYQSDGLEGEVMSIEYDPNRNCFILLINYKKYFRYIITPEGLKVGDKIISGESEDIPIQVGNNLPLYYIPVNTPIHNVELKPKKGGQLARSAGTYAKIIGKVGKDGRVPVKLRSKTEYRILATCRATIGKVSNSEANLVRLGKAGRSRWLGIRPTVRGTAQNAVDHPHGGGEGKAGIGHPSPLSPWGKKTLGKKTRKKNKLSDKYITKNK